MLNDLSDTQCKTSRTKCDEGRPKCTRCTKAGTACAYVPVGEVRIGDVDKSEAAPRTILPRIAPGTEIHDSIGIPAVDGAWHRLNELLAPEGVGGVQLLRYANPYLPDKSQELLYYCEFEDIFWFTMARWLMNYKISKLERHR